MIIKLGIREHAHRQCSVGRLFLMTSYSQRRLMAAKMSMKNTTENRSSRCQLLPHVSSRWESVAFEWYPAASRICFFFACVPQSAPINLFRPCDTSAALEGFGVPQYFGLCALWSPARSSFHSQGIILRCWCMYYLFPLVFN